MERLEINSVCVTHTKETSKDKSRLDINTL